jgi:hypothetical protein
MRRVSEQLVALRYQLLSFLQSCSELHNVGAAEMCPYLISLVR